MPRAKAKSAAPEVTELLHEDHKKVRDLFFKFSKSEDNSEKDELVKEILTELFIHSTVEEEIVYPACEEEAEDTKNLVDEAENEHRVVKFLMAELSKMNAESDQFEAKVTVLCELVNHHIKEEEKELFKKLRESGADLNELAEQVEARKEELKGEPLPVMDASLSIGGADEDAGEDEKEKEKEVNMKPKTARSTRKTSTMKQRKSA